MGGFGDLFGGLGEMFGGLGEIAGERVAESAAESSLEAMRARGDGDAEVTKYLTGAPRVLNINDI